MCELLHGFLVGCIIVLLTYLAYQYALILFMTILLIIGKVIHFFSEEAQAEKVARAPHGSTFLFWGVMTMLFLLAFVSLHSFHP